MKAFLSLILFLSFAFVGFGQQDYPDSGFTNKAEAKNLTVNGLKEGQWVEYFYPNSNKPTDDTSATYYALTIYKSGIRNGAAREYYKNGKIMSVGYFKNGKTNGKVNEYYENGKIKSILPVIDSKANGIYMAYYENGKLKSEVSYLSGIENGTDKEYDENGRLISEVPFKNGKKNGVAKGYMVNIDQTYEILYDNDSIKTSKYFSGNELLQKK